MNEKWETVFIIEAISRDIMQLSIRMEIIGVKDSDLKTIEAGAKRILRKVEELRKMDNAYCGNADEWILSVYRPNSFKDCPETIPAGTRLAQFRLEPDSPEIEFEPVDNLESESRGGFGSTGD